MKTRRTRTRAGGLPARDRYRRFATGETQSVPLPYTYVRKDGLRARQRGIIRYRARLKMHGALNSDRKHLGYPVIRSPSGRLDFP